MFRDWLKELVAGQYAIPIAKYVGHGRESTNVRHITYVAEGIVEVALVAEYRRHLAVEGRITRWYERPLFAISQRA